MLTRPLRVYLILWLISLCAWLGPPFVAWQFTELLPTGIVVLTSVLLGVSGVMTIVWGAVLTHRGFWPDVFKSVVVGSAVVIVGIVTAYSLSGGGEGSTGGELLAGLLIPTFVVVGFLLVLGGGIGGLRRRHMTPEMPSVGH